MFGGSGRSNLKAGRLVVGALFLALAMPHGLAGVLSPEYVAPPADELHSARSQAGIAGDERVETGDQGAGDESNSPQVPMIVLLPSLGVGDPVVTPTGEEKAAHGKCETDEERQTVECRDLVAQERMARFTGGALIVTAIGVVLIWLTLRYSRTAATAALGTVKEAEKATAAAIEGTKEAKRAADIAENSFRRLERPYLFIELIHTARLADPQFASRDKGALPGVLYTLVNFGKTPAILRSVAIGLQFSPDVVPPRTPMASWNDLYAAIEPGGKLKNGFFAPVAGSQSTDRYRGQDCTLLILHGHVRYEDTTGARHTDTFTLRGNPGGKTFRVEDIRRSTRYPGEPDDPDEV